MPSLFDVQPNFFDQEKTQYQKYQDTIRRIMQEYGPYKPPEEDIVKANFIDVLKSPYGSEYNKKQMWQKYMDTVRRLPAEYHEPGFNPNVGTMAIMMQDPKVFAETQKRMSGHLMRNSINPGNTFPKPFLWDEFNDINKEYKRQGLMDSIDQPRYPKR